MWLLTVLSLLLTAQAKVASPVDGPQPRHSSYDCLNEYSTEPSDFEPSDFEASDEVSPDPYFNNLSYQWLDPHPPTPVEQVFALKKKPRLKAPVEKAHVATLDFEDIPEWWKANRLPNFMRAHAPRKKFGKNAPTIWIGASPTQGMREEKAMQVDLWLNVSDLELESAPDRRIRVPIAGSVWSKEHGEYYHRGWREGGLWAKLFIFDAVKKLINLAKKKIKNKNEKKRPKIAYIHCTNGLDRSRFITLFYAVVQGLSFYDAAYWTQESLANYQFEPELRRGQSFTPASPERIAEDTLFYMEARLWTYFKEGILSPHIFEYALLMREHPEATRYDFPNDLPEASDDLKWALANGSVPFLQAFSQRGVGTSGIYPHPELAGSSRGIPSAAHPITYPEFYAQIAPRARVAFAKDLRLFKKFADAEAAAEALASRSR